MGIPPKTDLACFHNARPPVILQLRFRFANFRMLCMTSRCYTVGCVFFNVLCGISLQTPYYSLLSIWFTCPWWRHQMETFSALLAICAGNSPVTSEFPSQRPVMRSFDVSFDLRLTKRLSKQSQGWWFETQLRPIRRHSNAKRRGKLFMTLAVCDISKLKLRPHGEPIWARDSPDPQQHEAPLIGNPTTFKCYHAVPSIPPNCHMPPSIPFTIHLFFYCVVPKSLVAKWTSRFSFGLVLNAHWSVTD